ncbi:MAG: hypothetical protein HYR96_00800 [Deltaproteobacteria bacterium]|nr:hypothetical protein [Deltaproteobacteria bacterium]MBI3296093.1 hypothetical protein [Deltaproteobacteria bacterium]
MKWRQLPIVSVVFLFLSPACGPVTSELETESEANTSGQVRQYSMTMPATVTSLPRVDQEVATPVHTIQANQLGDDFFKATVNLGLDDKDYFIVASRLFAVDADMNQPSNVLHHALVAEMPSTKTLKTSASPVSKKSNNSSIGYGGLVGLMVMGTSVLQTPAGTGLKIRGNMDLTFNIHLNVAMGSATTLPKKVSVHVQFMFAPSVKHLAYFSGGVDPLWLLKPETMKIPANSVTTRGYTHDPFGVLPSDSKSLDLIGVLYHMHNLGSAGQISQVRSGASYTLNSDNSFSYANQYVHYFPSPVTLQKGKDKLFAQCTWTNTAERQPFVYGVQMPVKDVFWGESSTDEMCMWMLVFVEKGNAGLPAPKPKSGH